MLNKDYYKNPLFEGISNYEIEKLILGLSPTQKTYKKNEYIYLAGDKVDKIAILLDGKLFIEKIDQSGNKSIFSYIPKNAHFGDSYAISDTKTIMVDVRAAEDSEILFLKIDKILYSTDATTESEKKLLFNLLKILANKNLNLSRKIINTSAKTIRERLLHYLSEEKLLNGGSRFDIPYDRIGLANYLNCDRSQLSKELSKLRSEGLINYNKNHFEIYY